MRMKGPFLEIGVGHGESAILAGTYFVGKPERFGTNLSEMEVVEEEDETRIQFVRCNSQDMTHMFADGQFGTVLSNAVIEHDKYFWRSLDEMKRVLAPGGILAVGAPAYIPRSQIQENVISDRVPKGTVTLDLHSRPDYWRFSPMAFQEVICEGLELLEMQTVLRVPVLVAVARKPLTGLLPPVSQEERLAQLAQEKAARLEQRAARLEGKAKDRAEDDHDADDSETQEGDTRQAKVRLLPRSGRRRFGKPREPREPKAARVREPKLPRLNDSRVPKVKEPRVAKVKEPRLPKVKEPRIPRVKEVRVKPLKNNPASEGAEGGLAPVKRGAEVAAKIKAREERLRAHEAKVAARRAQLAEAERKAKEAALAAAEAEPQAGPQDGPQDEPQDEPVVNADAIIAAPAEAVNETASEGGGVAAASGTGTEDRGLGTLLKSKLMRLRGPKKDAEGNEPGEDSGR